MWVYSFLLLKFVVSDAAILFPASPCPTVFKYEDDSAAGDRWYGEFTIYSTTTVLGLSLRISLDRPSHLLVLWNNDVTSTDNQVYFANEDNESIEANTKLVYKIMVKFNQTQQLIPFLSTIHFNGRRVCPPDSVVTLAVSESSYINQRPPSNQRPDPVFTEATDINSDRSRTTTRTPTPPPPPPPPPKNYPCGMVEQVTPLITHGSGTLPGQWPWHVALYRTEGVNLNYKCGATLVSKNKVITAAHCVTNDSASSENLRKPINPGQLVLYLGKHQLHHFSEEGIQTKQVSRIVIHPGYNGNDYYGDLAVLTLSSDVDYSRYVRPVCLWEAASSTADIEGKEGSIVGWGLDENEQTTENLQVARLPIVSTVTCLRSFPQFYSKFTSNATFCAGARNGTSPCNGDSGGGMVFNRHGAWYLRGIVSLSVAKEGFNFCDPNHYAIFTDLAKFTDFIQVYVND